MTNAFSLRGRLVLLSDLSLTSEQFGAADFVYRRDAGVEDEQVVLDGGIAYKLTKIRFLEGNRVAWLAQRTFAPSELAVAEQHI